MHRFKLAGILLGALVALAAMAASASAFTLPDISVTLTGGTYPLESKGSSTAATKLGSASGVTLEGKGVSLTLKTAELSALGTFSATFSAVEAPSNKEKCKTGTEAAGTVVTPGEYHVVPLNATGTVGTLFLVSFVEIVCGTVKVKVRGNVISSLNAGSETTELTSFKGALLGENGKNKISEYINDSGSKIKASLESDAGLEFVQADENVAEEVNLEVQGSKMLVITGR